MSFFIKVGGVFFLSLGLVLSGHAGVPSADEMTETLSRGPWAELPVRAVATLRHAKPGDRNEMTIAVVKAALRLNPAAATAVVGSIARGIPAMAARAAEIAAAEQPKQAAEIALAASAANKRAAADIVTGVCRTVPAQYEAIADAVFQVVPESGKAILGAVETAEPDLRAPIQQVVAQYNGYLPPVPQILAEAKSNVGDGAARRNPFVLAHHKPPGGKGGNTGGSGGGPPDQYKVP